MIKKFLSNIKTKFTAVVTIIMVLCFGFTAFGCGKDESDYEYAMRIAKEEFRCEKILLYTGAKYSSGLAGVYLYDTYGHISQIPDDAAFEQERGGVYVLGVNSHGREKFIAIPDKLSTQKDSKKYVPKLIQWPLKYSFTEIIEFVAEYGYEYADGIDGLTDEQLIDYYKGSFVVLDCKETFIHYFKIFFEDAEKKYDELDVRFALYYNVASEDGTRMFYCIIQEDGKLNLYARKNPDSEGVKIITYERNKKTEE